MGYQYSVERFSIPMSSCSLTDEDPGIRILSVIFQSMNLFSEPCSNVGVSLCPSYRLRLWDIHSAKRMILASMDSGTKSEMAPLPVWRQPSKYMGFQTGNMVKAVVPKRKYQGTHIGCLELVLASSGCRSMKKIRPRNGPAFSMTVNGKIGMYYLPHTIIQPNHNYLRFFLSNT